MIIAGLVLDTEGYKILISSLFIGIIIFLSLSALFFKIFWGKIKENIVMSVLISILCFFPILLIWFILFGMLPPAIDSYYIVEPKKEYKVEILKKEFIKGHEEVRTKRNKRGKEEVVYKSKVDDNYRIYLKKWYDSKVDEPIYADVEKEEFNKYKEKQLVYLESYKGFLGFRHIVINDKALKPVEELNQSAVPINELSGENKTSENNMK